MLTDDAQLFSRPKEMNLFVTDCKYGLTETDVKHILKMKKGKNKIRKIWKDYKMIYLMIIPDAVCDPGCTVPE